MMLVFDNMAERYDADFTNTEIGKLQRNQVWAYLEQHFGCGKEIDILELNCGTGEDAIFLASKGHSVLATDNSQQMLEVAEKKMIDNHLEDRVKISNLDIRNLGDLSVERRFDVIFSNFGGLNCLNEQELSRLAADMPRVLKDSGRFVAVLMPTFCFWEFLYFTFKLKSKKGLRRMSVQPQSFRVNGSQIPVSYYKPRRFSNIFSGSFHNKGLRAIGLFIPPSYLEKFFTKRSFWLKMLTKLEKTFAIFPFTAAVSDHYLVDLQLKPMNSGAS